MSQHKLMMPRRDFLKWTAVAASAAGLLVGASPATADARLHIDAWRARPGAPLKVVLVVHGEGFGAPRVEVLMVRVERERGEVTPVGVSSLRAVGQGRWEGLFEAPGGPQGEQESYLLSAVCRDAQGRVAMSESVEVVCTPLMLGL